MHGMQHTAHLPAGIGRYRKDSEEEYWEHDKRMQLILHKYKLGRVHQSLDPSHSRNNLYERNLK